MTNKDESFVINGEKFFSAEQFKEVMIRRSSEYNEKYKDIFNSKPIKKEKIK